VRSAREKLNTKDSKITKRITFVPFVFFVFLTRVDLYMVPAE